MAKRKSNQQRKRQQRQRKRQEKRRKKTLREKKPSGSSSGEWIVGRTPGPFGVDGASEGRESYRPDVVLVVEGGSERVLGTELVAPEAVGAAARLLGETLAQERARSHRPSCIRVDNEDLAREIRQAFPGLTVVLGPTPVIETIIGAMAAMSPDTGSPSRTSELTYTDDGRIPAPLVGELFAAAETLWHVAPWQSAGDGQVLLVDVPELGVRTACLSILGNLGQERGFLLFPSVGAYEAFLDVADAHEGGEPEGPLPDLGSEPLLLSFEHGHELSRAMRKEVSRFGWPVAAADAYPVASRYLRHGGMFPANSDDYRLLTATTRALLALLDRHPDLFESSSLEGQSITHRDANGLEVRIRPPTAEDFDLPSAAPGSAPTPFHQMDHQLVARLLQFAEPRFGEKWTRQIEDLETPEYQLTAQWAVYHCPIDGSTILEHYLEQSEELPGALRSWADAQAVAWFSPWEVLRVEEDGDVTLRDPLSGEIRRVIGDSAPETLLPRQVLLARVVDFEDLSLICGLHSLALAPGLAAEVIARCRKRLRRKKANVPPVRLRDHLFARFLIELWQDAVEEHRTPALPRELVTTTGEPLLLVTDHFDVTAGDREAVAQALAAIADDEVPEEEGSEPGRTRFVFLNDADPAKAGGQLGRSVLGSAVLGRSLEIETFSVNRADELRRRVEETCGERVRYRIREQSDPLSEAFRNSLSARAPEPSSISDETAQQLVLDVKNEHYRDWGDQPLPALGGRTAREAVRSAEGRQQVDLLLAEMEYYEAKSPKGERFDFAPLRSDLGL